MLSKTLITLGKPLTIRQEYKRKCTIIATFVVFQCIAVSVGATTLLMCVWTPSNSQADYDKLVRIMYLYDPQTCGHNVSKAYFLKSVKLNSFTEGLSIKPIRFQAAIVTTSTRLATKTRMYVNNSLGFHTLWFVASIILYLVRLLDSEYIRIFRYILTVYLCITILIIALDISMGIVYIAHIQESLTNGMVLRYSGWSVELRLRNHETFAGWLPMVASVLWMRGILIMAFNIYSCHIMHRIIIKVKRREVKRRLIVEGNEPIPEPIHLVETKMEDNILYFRPGERKPQGKQQS